MTYRNAQRAGGNGALASERAQTPDAGSPIVATTRDNGKHQDDGPRRRYLAHFDKSRWGVVTNRFLAPIREGEGNNPQAVVNAVVYRLERLIEGAERWNRPCPELHAELDTIVEYEPEALAFARVCIDYLALPDDERQRIKAKRREDGIAQWMGDKAPSQKQLNYLRSLGHTGPAPATMLEASRLIDEKVQARRGGGRRV